MSGHTKLPWKHQGVDEDGECRGECFIVGVNQGGLVGAALPWSTELGSGDFSRVEANAAFIITAVNAHEALVEALRALHAAILDGLCNGGTPAYDKDAPARLDDAITAAERALKQAEGSK